MTKPNISKDAEKRWKWIRYQLRVHDSSLADLARQLGATDRTLCNAKHRSYPRVERAIASIIGVAPLQLWPERWNVDGTTARQGPRQAESNNGYDADDDAFCPVSHSINCDEGKA